jgi:hypothetical protein
VFRSIKNNTFISFGLVFFYLLPLQVISQEVSDKSPKGKMEDEISLWKKQSKNDVIICEICDTKIIGEYIIDHYGNIFHSKHEKEFPICSCCHRLICRNLTGDGKKLEDGRLICAICLNEIENEGLPFCVLYEDVVTRLNSFKFFINFSNYNIVKLNLQQLQRFAENKNLNLRGSVKTSIQSIDSICYKKFEIFILSNLTNIVTQMVIAHELMHLWIKENTSKKHSNRLIEGSCNFISYLFLISKIFEKENLVIDNYAIYYTINALIKEMENSIDPIYGIGFRLVRNRFNGRPLKDLFNYLLENLDI